ncbi:MAG: hypothetical protein U0744_07420 [Gemmataceae bacterium]
MSQNLPCPNPVCSHIFTAAAIQQAAGAALKCPLCGSAFSFRTTQTPAPIPPKPAAAPVAKIPVAPAAPVRAAKATPPPATSKNITPPTAPIVPKAAPLPAKPAMPVATAKPVLASPVVKGPPPVAPIAPRPSADVDVVLEESEASFMPTGPSLPVPDLDTAPTGSLVKARHISTKSRWTWKHWTGLSVGLIVFLGSLGATAYWLVPYVRENANTGEGAGRSFSVFVRNVQNKDEKAFKLKLPADTWIPEKELTTRMMARVAYKHSSADVWFAVAVRDYGFQRPRDAELLKEAIDRLESHFGDALELDAKTKPSKLGGQDAQSFRFKGQFNSVLRHGECTMCAYNGFGYWLFVAAPSFEEAEQAKVDIEGEAAGFALDTIRQGWREQPQKLDLFAAQKAPFQMKVPSGIWERHDAKDEDERGELFLFGRFPKEKDNRKNASILVTTMDRGTDLKETYAAARKYMEEKKQEESKDNRFAPMEEGGTESASVEDVGDRRGMMTELKLINKEDPKRYYLLAVVMDSERAYVIRMDSTWESRQIWRQDFKDILRTIRITAKSE